jgi:hypothetical protein
MLIVTIAGCLLLGVVIYLFTRRAVTTAPDSRAPKDQRFDAVALVPGTASCTQAISLSSQLMLVSEAPMLPLSGCTETCHCTYRKRSADRREINRRRNDDGVPEFFPHAGAENRSGDSRRTSTLICSQTAATNYEVAT